MAQPSVIGLGLRKPKPTKQEGSSWWIPVVLFALTIAVYAPVRTFDFVNYDDPDYVTSNPHVLQGLSSESVRWALTSTDAANWLPLTRLSHLMDVQLFRTDAGMHHLVNVFLHAFAAAVLFLFLQRATRARWRSALVACVWALHPLHVESVAWIAERKDVLCAVFWFLALWAYVIYTENKRGAWYVATATCFCLGLLAKPMIVTLPALLILLDWWPLNRVRTVRFSRLILEKVPLFVIAVAAALITYSVQSANRAVKTLQVFPLRLRVSNALVSCSEYLANTFWPHNLAVFYPYPAQIAAWAVIVSGLLVLAVTVVALWMRKTHRYVLVGWLWFLIALLPVIGLVQVGVQARADRYTYVPMVGLLVVVAWGVGELSPRSLRTQRLLAGMGCAACVACAAVTTQQLQYWRNSETLFAHAAAVTSGNYVAEHNLGLAIANDPARIGEAISHYRAALAIRPDSVEAHSDLGNALAATGQLQQAATEFQTALRLAPDSAIPHNNLGNVYFRLGRIQPAIEQYQAAIRLRPDYAEAHNNLGAALATSGQMQAATEQFKLALRIDPEYAQAKTNLDLATKPAP